MPPAEVTTHDLQQLLACDPRMPAGACLQPRALRLPLRQQHDLLLQAAAQPGHNSSCAQARLWLQLTQLLGRHSCSASIKQLSAALLDAHQQQLLPPPPLPGVAAAAAPAWLRTAPSPCFSWQASPDSACSTVGAAAPATPGQARAAAGQAVQGVINSSLQQQQQHDEGKQRQHKRPRLSTDVCAPSADTTQPAGAHTAGLSDADVQELLQQLQARAAGAGMLGAAELQLLHEALSAAACASPPSWHVALQEALQQLPLEAMQHLLAQLLDGSSSSSSSPLPPGAVTALLAAMLLPQVQQLGGPAPQVLLHALKAAGASHLDALVDAVLQPVVLCSSMAPVQAQLLARLLRELPALAPRLLQLLLRAAGTAEQQAGGGVLRPSSCCWSGLHASLLTALLGSCPQAVGQELDAVLVALQAAVQGGALHDNAGLGHALMALVKAFSAVLTGQQVAQLQAIVGATTSFLTRGLAARLQQLAQQRQAARACGEAVQ